MRMFISIVGLLSLCGCSSFGGVLSSETTWFQDWSCERQDGVCARTDTIDAITVTEIGGDPAEAGPVSGYPSEALPLLATPELLGDVRPLDRGYFEEEMERGRPFLEASFADEQAIAASAALASTPSAFSIDAVMTGTEEGDGFAPETADPFVSAFPGSAASAQFAVLNEKLAGAAQLRPQETVTDPDPIILASDGGAGERPSDSLNVVALASVQALGDTKDPSIKIADGMASADLSPNGPRVTRTVISRDGVLVPLKDRVSEIIDPLEMAAPGEEPESVARTATVRAAYAAIEPRYPPEQKTATEISVLPGPRRSAAKILPVLISAYVDAKGVFHERKTVWVEVEPADWVME